MARGHGAHCSGSRSLAPGEIPATSYLHTDVIAEEALIRVAHPCAWWRVGVARAPTKDCKECSSHAAALVTSFDDDEDTTCAGILVIGKASKDYVMERRPDGRGRER